jgi:hypothetical protein
MVHDQLTFIEGNYASTASAAEVVARVLAYSAELIADNSGEKLMCRGIDRWYESEQRPQPHACPD